MLCRFLHTGGVERVNRVLKRTLQLVSPHFCLGRGIYQVGGDGGSRVGDFLICRLLSAVEDSILAYLVRCAVRRRVPHACRLGRGLQ